jgi:hypothetical protein
MTTPPSRHTFASALFITLTLVAPVMASPPECNCKNITSLQQDYSNAKALEAYFRKLETHMKEVEADLDVLTKGDTAKKIEKSEREYSDYQRTFPPGQVMTPVDGYTGPGAIEMIDGKCEHDDKDLKALEAGSPCKAMAEAALNHEAFHRAACRSKESADAYWNQRLWSEVAHEEAQAYEAQAKELKNELKRVLDASEVTYSGDWTLDMNIGGMAQYGYRYTAQSEDIGGASGDERWTMTGKGTGTVTWTKAMIMGKSCNPSGKITSNYSVKMITDGLTFDLEVDTLSASGALSIKCPGPGGGGGFGADAGSGGKIATGLQVKEGVTPLPGDMGSEMRKILAGTGTVSGSGKRELSITCSGP